MRISSVGHLLLSWTKSDSDRCFASFTVWLRPSSERQGSSRRNRNHSSWNPIVYVKNQNKSRTQSFDTRSDCAHTWAALGEIPSSFILWWTDAWTILFSDCACRTKTTFKTINVYWMCIHHSATRKMWRLQTWDHSAGTVSARGKAIWKLKAWHQPEMSIFWASGLYSSRCLSVHKAHTLVNLDHPFACAGTGPPETYIRIKEWQIFDETE